MSAVNAVDAIKYGFQLLGYLLAVFVVAFVLAIIGQQFMPGPLGGGNIILGAIFLLAALAIFYAGSLGLMYKVIADGVAVGTNSNS